MRGVTFTSRKVEYKPKDYFMFSLKRAIIKSIKYFIIFILPVLVDKFIIQYPEFAQITIGAILVGVVNFLKIKYQGVWRTK